MAQGHHPVTTWGGVVPPYPQCQGFPSTLCVLPVQLWVPRLSPSQVPGVVMWAGAGRWLLKLATISGDPPTADRPAGGEGRLHGPEGQKQDGLWSSR